MPLYAAHFVFQAKTHEDYSALTDCFMRQNKVIKILIGHTKKDMYVCMNTYMDERISQFKPYIIQRAIYQGYNNGLLQNRIRFFTRKIR